MSTTFTPLDAMVVIPDPPALWGPMLAQLDAPARDLLDGIDDLVARGVIIEVTRPDGEPGYAPAPPLPCPMCSGSGFDWDADLELSGLCPDCGGTGIEEL